MSNTQERKMNTIYVFIISVIFVADLCSCFRFHPHNKGDVADHFNFGAGYRRKVPANDSVVVSMARWAAQQLNGKLITVNSAEKQVVAGMMYYINLTLMEEKTKKDLTCYVKVWWRAWIHSTKLVHHRCY